MQDVFPTARAGHAWENVRVMNRNTINVSASSEWGQRKRGFAGLDGMGGGGASTGTMSRLEFSVAKMRRGGKRRWRKDGRFKHGTRRTTRFCVLSMFYEPMSKLRTMAGEGH